MVGDVERGLWVPADSQSMATEVATDRRRTENLVEVVPLMTVVIFRLERPVPVVSALGGAQWPATIHSRHILSDVRASIACAAIHDRPCFT